MADVKYETDVVLDDTASGEVGTITINGVSHAAWGFHLDAAAGRMTAYPFLVNGELWLTAWGGERIVRLTQTGVSYGLCRTKLYHYRTAVPYLGHYWYGKGLGVGMLLRLKRGRKGEE